MIFMNFLQQFQYDSVRELAWCLTSSPLFSRLGENIHLNRLPLNDELLTWLQQLDENPIALNEFLALNPKRRLGLRFEQLWHFYLSHHSPKPVIHNLQVHADGRTLGEFDSIYFCPERERWVHAELAIKFYLGLENSDLAQTENWWGPECRDRLDIKLDRLLDHQTQLKHTPAAQQLLAEQGIDWHTLETEICMRGILFYPPSHTDTAKLEGIHPEHNVGRWLRLSEFNDSEGQYWVLDKPDWLVPITGRVDTASGQKLLEAITEQIDTTGQPLMIAKLEHANSGFNEVERLFVTPDNWPWEFRARK